MEYKVEINKEIEIPSATFAKWQEFVDILARFANVPAALIMKVEPPMISVFTTSKTKENPYKKGNSDPLAGLYCETVLMKKMASNPAWPDQNRRAAPIPMRWQAPVTAPTLTPAPGLHG